MVHLLLEEGGAGARPVEGSGNAVEVNGWKVWDGSGRHQTDVGKLSGQDLKCGKILKKKPSPLHGIPKKALQKPPGAKHAGTAIKSSEIPGNQHKKSPEQWVTVF